MRTSPIVTALTLLAASCGCARPATEAAETAGDPSATPVASAPRPVSPESAAEEARAEPASAGPESRVAEPAAVTPRIRTAFDAARSLVESGELGRAAAWLAELRRDDPSDGKLFVLSSVVARKLGRPEEAVDLAERGVELLPQDSDAHFQYGRALGDAMQVSGKLSAMRRLGPYKGAIQRAIDLDPRNVDARVEQIAFHLIAPGIAGGSKKEGLELARELVAIDARRGRPLLAWALDANGRGEEAIELCRSGLAADPTDHPLAKRLGDLLQEHGRPREADAAYATVAEGPRDRLYYEALYQRGKLRTAAGFEPERAIELLRRYAREAPEERGGGEMPPRAAAWWRIGLAQELLGRTEDARAAYREALRLDPDFDDAQDALDELE